MNSCTPKTTAAKYIKQKTLTKTGITIIKITAIVGMTLHENLMNQADTNKQGYGDINNTKKTM